MTEHLTYCPKSLQSKKKLAGAGVGRFFDSRERCVWRAREGYGGANATQSPKSVDWDLTREYKTLK